MPEVKATENLRLFKKLETKFYNNSDTLMIL